MTTRTPHVGAFGVWTGGAVSADVAARIESLGYQTLWVGFSPSADLSFAEPILERTTTLTLATGIVNVWTAPPATVADSYHRIESAHPGRFVLGVGAGHREHTAEYTSPYTALIAYLDALDAAGVPTNRRVLAALGPKVLALAAERSLGAHPYLTTPEHTREARSLVGENALLAPEHKVMLSTSSDQARGIGRQALDMYLGLRNYQHSWKRLGLNDRDIAKPGSDRLIDAVVAHGTAAEIAARLGEHLTAGANHVAVQVLGGPDALLPTLAELAGPLGLDGDR